jgi:hypothetical protein
MAVPTAVNPADTERVATRVEQPLLGIATRAAQRISIIDINR